MDEWLKGNYPAIYGMFLEYLESESYLKSEMTKQIDDFTLKLSGEIKKLVGVDAADTTSEYLLSCGYGREAVGFINGFQFAAQLMSECMPKATQVNIKEA